MHSQNAIDFIKKPGFILSTATLIVFILYFFLRPAPSFVEQIPQVDYASDDVPLFAQIENVKEKKKAYFDYLKPAIALQNDYIREVRDYLKVLQDKLAQANELNPQEMEDLAWLANEYRVETDQSEDAQIKSLLRRVDIIPRELVLVQSANESAWGTSRFAREGYNFFGMWCFVQDCGFVPKRRNDGAVHEVAKYDDLSHALYAYMRNLNRHPAYQELRDIRASLRKNGKNITANALAQGLSQYSERGEEYIHELQQMIRVNRELI